MATPIDDKVVAMSFESSKFEQGVQASLNALDKLKKAMTFKDVGAGLENISRAVGHIQLGQIGDAADKVQKRLKAMQLVAIGVISNLTAGFIRSGAAFAKSFTIQPIIQGFKEYSTNLNSIQTILANTQASGANLQDVNKALDELNQYSDKTIYNFSQMARNIGTFTAAGVDLDTSTASIKGIANLAALSGSNAEQAATAMYQLSQAISAGKVNLMDWNSVVNAGMGGTVFQRALAQTAEAMGTLKKGAVELTGPMKNVSIHGKSFRNSITAKPGEESWLTSKVLTTTLKQFTGDLKDSELAAMGFNQEQIKAIQQTAKTAQHAATEVKTIQQVFDVAKETIGSGWALTFRKIFGDFEESKKTFTAMSEAVNGFINANAEARNKVLGDWKALGGRKIIIDAISQAFRNLGAMLKAISAGFRAVFPAKTGKDLFNLTKGFANLVEKMKPSQETLARLMDISANFFSAIHIGVRVLKGVVKMFQSFFNAIGGGQGNFLKFTANSTLFFQKIDTWLGKGDKLNKFFIGLGELLAKPIKAILKIRDAIAGLFSTAEASKKLGGISEGLSPLKKLVETIERAWSKFVDSIQNANIQPAVDAVVRTIQSIGPAIGKAASTMDFEPILAVIRTGLLGGMFLILKRFLGKGSLLEQLSNTGGGFVKNLSATFDALTGSVQALQQNIKANTLKQIATSIFLLAASATALSFVKPDRLKKALSAMTVAFGELLGSMAVLTMIGKTGAITKLPFIAASLVILAGAIDTLAIAVVAFSFLSWEEIAKGLAGVGGSLAILLAAAIPLGKASPGLIRAGIGISAVAVGLNIMAFAVAKFGSMNLKELAKGLGSVGAVLVLMIATLEEMPAANMMAIGAGLIGIGIGMRILASAVEKFGGMDLRTLVVGLGAVGGALFIIAAAMEGFPPSMPVIAAGLLIVSFALGKIADSIIKMGVLKGETIAKGLIALAGAMLILVAALNGMTEAIPGAIALGIAAAGIFLLSKALVKMGGQSWGQILKGLLTLAAALTILGIAGALLTPVIPTLLGLGVALVLIGGGLALAGAGIALIGVGLSAIAVAGPTAIGILVSALKEIYKTIPEFVKNLMLGLLEVINMLSVVAPKFIAAVIKIVGMLLDALIQLTPKFVKVVEMLIDALLKVISDKQGPIIEAGLQLLLALLKGIRDHISEVVKVVLQIVANFLTGIKNNINKVIGAGASVVIAIVKGIVDNLGKILLAATQIVGKIISTIVTFTGQLAGLGLKILTAFLSGIANNLKNVIKAAGDVLLKLIEGFGGLPLKLVNAGTKVLIKFLDGVAKKIPEIADHTGKAILNILKGIDDAINKYTKDIVHMGEKIAWDLTKGVVLGVATSPWDITKAGWSIATDLAKGVKDKLDSKSPSKVMMAIAQDAVYGFALGLDDHKDVINSAAAMSNGVINGVKSIFQITSPSKVMMRLGEYVTKGFAEGIRGSSDDVKNAFSEMDQKLLEAAQGARKTIASEQAKLKTEMSQATPDMAAIQKSQAIIAQNQALLQKSTSAHILLTQVLKGTKNELMGLTVQYDAVSAKLVKANETLAEARKLRDDAVKGFTDQYSALPDIVTEDAEGNAVDQLATYMGALKNQADAVAAYQSTLDQLRQLGLDDATYQKLLEEGTADQAFATQLLAGGKTAVQGLNTLDAQLKKNAKVLGDHAGKNLYQAGVDAAKGVVKGLKSQQGYIYNQMEAIARTMVAALKKELGIKSPSKVFAEIGGYMMEGLGVGLQKSGQILSDAFSNAADDAMSAMKKSMQGISDVVTQHLNPNPTITPVLDLTQVRTQAGELAALTSPTSVATASFNQASAISSQTKATQEQDVLTAAPGGTTVKFEQNNYSPEALSAIDIYRQTRNQLSQFNNLPAVSSSF